MSHYIPFTSAVPVASAAAALSLSVNNGQCILAAKVIVRAWTNFKFAKRLQYMLDEHRVIMYSAKVRRE